MYEDFTPESTSRFPDRSFHALLLALVLGGILFMLGCSTKGDSDSESTDLQVKVVPVKIAREGQTALHGLFAFAKGPGVSGFRLLDAQKNVLATVNALEPYNQEYRCYVARNQNSFPSTSYTVQYFQNGETKEYVSPTLEWTTVREFPSSPYYSQSENKVEVRYSPISGGSFKYRLEIYDEDISPGRLLYQSYEYPYNTLFSERVSGLSGRTVSVVLVGNDYSGGDLSSKTIYQFNPKPIL